MTLDIAAHPLYIGFTKRFGASISETICRQCDLTLGAPPGRAGKPLRTLKLSATEARARLTLAPEALEGSCQRQAAAAAGGASRARCLQPHGHAGGCDSWVWEDKDQKQMRLCGCQSEFVDNHWLSSSTWRICECGGHPKEGGRKLEFVRCPEGEDTDPPKRRKTK